MVVRGRRRVSGTRAARVASELRATRHLCDPGRDGARLEMFDRQAALRALEELATVLESRGIAGRLFVVGGVAIALAFDARRITRDIDAVFEPKSEVYSAAREVADRLELPDEWLNDAVKGFIPGTDPDALPVFDRPGLAVTSASARFLL